MDKKIDIQILVGPHKEWKLTVCEDDEGNWIPEISRVDGRSSRVIFLTKGFDRPIIQNFGQSKVVVAVDRTGAVAVELEEIVLTPEVGDHFTHNRVIRASADNPKYSKLPGGYLTGKNYLDGQRVLYRDSVPESLATAIEKPPMMATKYGLTPCEMLTLSEIGESFDAPGKAAIFDALALFLPELLNVMGIMLYQKLSLNQQNT